MSRSPWEKRIKQYESGAAIPASLVNMIKSAFNHPIMWESCRNKLLFEEHAIYQYGSGPGWSITPEQTTKCLKWLAQPKIMELFDDEQRVIIADFDKFTFEGIYPDMIGLHYTGDIVYRVHSKSGDWFDYSFNLWMSNDAGLRIYNTVVFAKEK